MEEVHSMSKKKVVQECFKEHPDWSSLKIAKACKCDDSYVRKIMREQRAATPEAFSSTLKERGFNEENWSHGWLKTGDVSIFIRNESGLITYEEMREELVSEMKKHAPKYPKLKRKKITDGHLLVVDPADIHIGKLSILAETNDEYNIEIAKQRCLDGVDGLIEKSSGFPIEKIILVIGNDIIHIDSPHRKTTAGTPQDTDGQWWQMFKEAKDLYVRIIDRLIPIADVEVIFCPSNHDFAAGYMLADTLTSWYRKCKNVTFQADIVHRKYVEYGKNMLGFDHGDGCKEIDAKDLMADEQPQMWGRTKFRYIYKHHVHHMKRVRYLDGKDHIGVTIQYLRSPSPADSWHHRNGYVSQKAIEGFVLHPQNGQLAHLTHYFI